MPFVVRAIVAVGAIAGASLPIAATAQEVVVLDAACLCQRGDKKDMYFGRIALTNSNRDKIKELIEANTFGLKKTVTFRGNGCGKDGVLSGMDARCGDTSVPGPKVGGKVTYQSIPNTEFVGEVTIQISYNAGIPRVPGTPDDKPQIDPARWPKTDVIQAGGIAMKVTPKQ
ncbi:MAG TPA: hypothetical protein PK970_08365 [Hyphomicrobiaceae bacterium]|nr:hypothetical protein [Hyphomicrobiaceae bacterium]